MGFQDVLYAASRDQAAVSKRVYFQGTDTVYEGMPVFYNSDTTDNVCGLAVPTTVGTTAEGYQNEGKYFFVEKEKAANLLAPAGVVAKGSWVGTTGPCYMDIYIINGAVVPVRCNANIARDDAIYFVNNSYACGITPLANAFAGWAMETVDRSTAGLCLVRLTGGNAYSDVITSSTTAGAGAIGTGVAPLTYRRVVNGEIITDIKVDLQGLASVATANDVIGLAAGGAAYIGRNVVATNGVIYKMQLICLETPATGDNDVNVVLAASAAIAYDGAGGTTYGVNGGDAVAGQVVENLVPVLTADYYLYLTAGTGDTAATYTAGQFIVRLFGHPVLT
jgi:hypothetical protein